MTYKYILDEHGNPVREDDTILWARWFESADRHVAYDKFDRIAISTVFLGLDHNYGGGPPLLYETMIFGGPHDGDTWRYATMKEAIAGHEHAKKLALEE